MKPKNNGSSPIFEANEIVNLPSLAAMLHKPERPVPQFIASQLAAETHPLLAGYCADGSGAQMVLAALTKDLVRIISGESICDRCSFDDVELSPKARQCLGRKLQGQALLRSNRLLLESAFPSELAKRFNKGKRQQRVRVGTGMFRIAGEVGIHGKIKIKGKTYSKKLTESNNAEEAKEAYEKWVVEKRKSAKAEAVMKGSLKSFVPAYLEVRQGEVDLGTLKQGTVDDLVIHFGHLEAHWPAFATVDLSALEPPLFANLRKYLLHDALNRSIKDPKKRRKLSKATYNTYIGPLVMLLKFLKQKNLIAIERYYAMKDEIRYARVQPRKIKLPILEQLRKMRAGLYRVRQGRSKGDAGPKFDFMMLCGARRKTANASMVDHYDPVNRTLLLTQLKARANQPTEKRVPICAELAGLLDRLIKARGLKPGSKFFQTANNNTAFRTAAKKAGIDRWFHHACRYWFGTTTLFETHDPVLTAELLCHHDGGATLIKVYRQECAEHLQHTVRALKLYPGANADSSLTLALEHAQKAVSKVGLLPPEMAAVALDRILWVASRLDAGDLESIVRLPGLAQGTLPIYATHVAPTLEGPSAALIKRNFKHLLSVKGAYHSDVAAETGITRSVVAVISKCGNLQARYLPALCKYFGVTIHEFLASDLSVPASQLPEKPTANAADSPGDLDPAPEQEEKIEATLDDIITRLDPAELPKVLARNLESMMFERNLTAHSLSLQAGLAGSAVHGFVQDERVPTDSTARKLAQALGVPVNEIYDPRRANIVIDGPVLISNIKAIVAHHGMATSTYFVRLNLDSRSMHEVLVTGQIVASQAHRIVEAEGNKFSLKELVSQDITSACPPAAVIDPLVVSRNLTSVTWEQGRYVSEIARTAGVSLATGLNYAQAKSGRIARHLLAEIANAVGLTLEDLANPSRPVVQPTALFASNLEHFTALSGLALTPLGEACGLDFKVLRALLAGSEPNQHQVANLARYFGLSCRELLMEDLCQRNLPVGTSTPGLAAESGSGGGVRVKPEVTDDPNQTAR